MPLTVEDGTGVTGADSYVALAAADAFFAARNETAWAGYSTAAREGALIQACEWLDTSHAWAGAPLTTTQGLAWPRAGVTGAAGVPPAITTAALRIAASVAAGAVLWGSVSADAMVRRVQAGSVTVEFDDRAADYAARGAPTFPWLAGLVSGLVSTAAAGEGSRRLVRV